MFLDEDDRRILHKDHEAILEQNEHDDKVERKYDLFVRCAAHSER